jgi:hypothetical protein
MKWTLNFERIDEAGILESRVVGHIERPELGSEVDLGLTHDDGKSLIRQIQAEVADDQVQSFISKTRPCSGCYGLCSIKDHRRVGTAMVYPTLTDASHPSWRARSLSVYRFWRDLGYAIGALTAGIIADLFGAAWAIASVGALTFASGVLVAIVMREQVRP